MENGLEPNAYTCVVAGRGGQLEMLKCLRAKGCEWDNSTYCYAALRGDLEVLKTEDTVHVAQCHGCRAVLLIKFFREQRDL